MRAPWRRGARQRLARLCQPYLSIMPLDVEANMTEFGLMKTMTISYFKAHISEQLRRVRKGARIVISDRDTPIAEVVPYKPQASSLVIRAPLVTPFKAPRASFRIDHDPLEYLEEERRKR